MQLQKVPDDAKKNLELKENSPLKEIFMKMKKETSPNVSQFNDQSPEKIDEAFLSPSKESPIPEKSLASQT
jgi:hypothetical protein